MSSKEGAGENVHFNSSTPNLDERYRSENYAGWETPGGITISDVGLDFEYGGRESEGQDPQDDPVSSKMAGGDTPPVTPRLGEVKRTAKELLREHAVMVDTGVAGEVYTGAEVYVRVEDSVPEISDYEIRLYRKDGNGLDTVDITEEEGEPVLEPGTEDAEVIVERLELSN